jgi:hypothetical protein
LGGGKEVEIEFPLQEPLDASNQHQSCVALEPIAD